MSNETEMRQVKCRQDYKVVVKQCQQLMEKLEAKNAPQKRQKRSMNYEAEKTTAVPATSEKMDGKGLEETIRDFLQELD